MGVRGGGGGGGGGVRREVVEAPECEASLVEPLRASERPRLARLAGSAGFWAGLASLGFAYLGWILVGFGLIWFGWLDSGSILGLAFGLVSVGFWLGFGLLSAWLLHFRL